MLIGKLLLQFLTTLNITTLFLYLCDFQSSTTEIYSDNTDYSSLFYTKHQRSWLMAHNIMFQKFYTSKSLKYFKNLITILTVVSNGIPIYRGEKTKDHRRDHSPKLVQCEMMDLETPSATPGANALC